MIGQPAAIFSRLFDGLGHPDAGMCCPGPPIPRCEGRPFKLSAKRRMEMEWSAKEHPDTKRRKQCQNIIYRSNRWERMADYRQRLKESARKFYTKPPMEGPLLVMFQFEFDKKTFPMKPMVKTPDSKNLIWCAEDALNGILWKDDSQVHPIGIRLESNIDLTTIFIWKLES